MRKRHSLEIIHDALCDPLARAVLGHLSVEDVQHLHRHAREKTLAPGLSPLIGQTEIADAIRAMPAGLGEIVGKLPDETIGHLRDHLSAIADADGGGVHCTC